MSSSNSNSENTPQQRVTLRDIAKEIGISHSTVSLSLRNHPRISEPVKDKVRKTAARLGYIPDPMLSALSQYRLKSKNKDTTLTLASLNAYGDPQKLHSYKEFALYQQGASDFAKQQGFRFEEFSLAELPLDRLHTILHTRNIRGLLLSTPDPTFDVKWNAFPWENYATVRFGRSSRGPQTHFVTSAQDSNAIKAFDKISEKGYKRIGLITRYKRRRLFGGGFIWAQFEVPPEDRIPILFLKPDEHSLRKDADLLKKWIDDYTPEAILTDNEYVEEILSRIGIRVPQDIALATTSIHDTPIDSGIDQKPEEIGRAAARTLISLILSNSIGLPNTRNEILIQGEWVDGTHMPNRR